MNKSLIKGSGCSDQFSHTFKFMKTHEHITVCFNKSFMNSLVCMLCMALKALLHLFNVNLYFDCSVFILLFRYCALFLLFHLSGNLETSKHIN